MTDDFIDNSDEALRLLKSAKASSNGSGGKKSSSKNSNAQADIPDNAKVANTHGDSWVTITGMAGRYTWQELESYVNSGKVEEIYDADTNTVRYKKVG